MTGQIDSNAVRAACKRVRAAVQALQAAADQALALGITVDLVEPDNPTLSNPDAVIYDVRLSLDVTDLGEGTNMEAQSHDDD